MDNNRDYRFYLIFIAILVTFFTIVNVFGDEIDPDSTREINTAVVAKRPEFDKNYDSSIIYIEQHGYKRNKRGKNVPDYFIFLKYYSYGSSGESYDGRSYTINYKDDVKPHNYKWDEQTSKWVDVGIGEYESNITFEGYSTKIVQLNSDNAEFNLSKVNDSFFTYSPVLSLKKLQIMSGVKLNEQIQIIVGYLIPFVLSFLGFSIVLWVGLRKFMTW